MSPWFVTYVWPIITLVLGGLITWILYRSNERFRLKLEREREEVRQQWQMRYSLWEKKHEDYRDARKLVASILRRVYHLDMHFDQEEIRRLPARQLAGEIEALLPYEEVAESKKHYVDTLSGLALITTDSHPNIDMFKDDFTEATDMLLKKIDETIAQLPFPEKSEVPIWTEDDEYDVYMGK